MDANTKEKYNPVHAIVKQYEEDAGQLSENISAMGVKLHHLSALSNEDLELLGVTNERTRQDILNDFASLPNQLNHYDETMSQVNEKEYNDKVFENVASHLELLKRSLLAANLKFKLHPTNDLLANQKVYTSKLVTKQLDHLIELSAEMEATLNQMRDGSEKPKSPSVVGKAIKFSIITGILGLGAFVVYKNLKPKPI